MIKRGIHNDYDYPYSICLGRHNIELFGNELKHSIEMFSQTVVVNFPWFIEPL